MYRIFTYIEWRKKSYIKIHDKVLVEAKICQRIKGKLLE